MVDIRRCNKCGRRSNLHNVAENPSTPWNTFASEQETPTPMRLDGRYLRGGGIVTLPKDDAESLRIFRTSDMTHQNLNESDCRRMLELMQNDDEVRNHQRNNGDCFTDAVALAQFMKRWPGMAQQINPHHLAQQIDLHNVAENPSTPWNT